MAAFAAVFMIVGRAEAVDPPSLSIGDATVAEGNAGTRAIEFAITRTGDLSERSTVTATTSPSAPPSAQSPADYVAKTEVLTFVADDPTETFSVQVAGDELNELDETFKVSLSDQTNATVTKPDGIGTITNDDPLPEINAISSPTVLEGNSGTVNATFTVSLSKASGQTVTVQYATAPGSAQNNSDFVPSSGEISFTPGSDLTRNIVVQVNGDTLAEQDEQFVVNLFSPQNAALTATQGTATITDDDAADPHFAPVVNPRESDENAVFKLTLVRPRSGIQATYDYRLIAGSAKPGSDYELVAQQTSITFPASNDVVEREIPITIVGDTVDELDETFKVEVSRPSDGALVTTVDVTILNDDNNSTLRISDGSADEVQGGQLKLTVSLSAASGRPVSVHWATANGTATAGADYTESGGQVDFGPGETAKEIAVPILGDGSNEDNETFTVNLSGASGASISDGQGQGTIVDKNAPPSLSISDVSISEGEGANFTVTLAGTTLRTVTVRFNTSDGTAKAGSDYSARTGTLTFASGEKTKSVAVTVLDDAAAEVPETFFVEIGDAVNATITKARGTAAIDASDQVAAPAQLPTTPKTPTTPKVTLLPQMLLGPGNVKVGANGIARMFVSCKKASPLACAGTIELERAAKPLLKLGRKTFSAAKGKKAFVSIKLSARSLKILRKNKTMRARVIVLVKTTAAKPLRKVPGVVVLESTKPKPKPKAKPQPPAQVVVDP